MGRRRLATIISQDHLSEWFARRKLAKPFLRWAGGKQPFLHRYGVRIPSFHGRYVEPFLGSGSVFFYVQRTQARPTPALLGDANLQLILTFYEVRDDPETVHRKLAELASRYFSSEDKRGFYEDLRKRYNSTLPRVDPATFIFLNRTCWNGLYRLNRNGLFNVPHGSPKGVATFPTLDDLQNAAAALRQAQFKAATWENVIASCEEGDFAFLDPPYFSDLLGEPKYGLPHFDLAQHRKLARALIDLKRRGVDFILTNSAEEELVELYQGAGLSVEQTLVPRSISSDLENRSVAKEIIVSARPQFTLTMPSVL